MSSTLILSLILAVSAPSFADPGAADADLHGTGAAGAHDEDGGAAPEDGSSTSDPGMPAAESEAPPEELSAAESIAESMWILDERARARRRMARSGVTDEEREKLLGEARDLALRRGL